MRLITRCQGTRIIYNDQTKVTFVEFTLTTGEIYRMPVTGLDQAVQVVKAKMVLESHTKLNYVEHREVTVERNGRVYYIECHGCFYRAKDSQGQMENLFLPQHTTLAELTQAIDSWEDFSGC